MKLPSDIEDTDDLKYHLDTSVGTMSVKCLPKHQQSNLVPLIADGCEMIAGHISDVYTIQKLLNEPSFDLTDVSKHVVHRSAPSQPKTKYMKYENKPYGS